MCVSVNVLFAKADTQLVTKTATVTFSESQQQSQSKSITLPNLSSIDSVSVDNGSVGYSVTGNNLTVNVSNGSVKRTNTPSKSASGLLDQYVNSSFPGSMGYNDGTYSGILYQNGGAYVISGGYTGAWDEKVDLGDGGGGYFYWYWNDGLDIWSGSAPAITPTHYVAGEVAAPGDFPYNFEIDQYYWVGGVIYTQAHGNIRQCYIHYHHFCWVHHNAVDTRTYRQNYSGTVYAATQNYYSYTVTVNYKAQYTKPALTVTADNSNNQINLSWNMSESSQTYKYTIFKKGPLDSVFQNIASAITGMSWIDANGKDVAAASIPSISGVTHNDDDSQFTVNYSSADNGTIYQYYVEATGQTDGTKIQSPTISSTIMTGIKGYSIAIDDSPNTVSNGAVNIAATSYTFLKPDSLGFYIHVTAVDNAGNVSAVTHYHVDDVISVTHPVCISYSIDPNSATPFTAQDIPITNNSAISVKVSIQSLNAVAGGTLLLNDILPTKYADWSKLTASQTKSDLALGVSVKETVTGVGNWSSINTTNMIYSANLSGKTLLGILSPNGARGTLNLTAKYGLAWDQNYTAAHSMILIFELT